MPIIIAPEPWRSEAGHAPRTGFTSPAFTASWHSSSTGEPMNVTAWPSSPARLHRGRGNAGKNLPSPCGGTVRSAFGRLIFAASCERQSASSARQRSRLFFSSSLTALRSVSSWAGRVNIQKFSGSVADKPASFRSVPPVSHAKRRRVSECVLWVASRHCDEWRRFRSGSARPRRSERRQGRSTGRSRPRRRRRPAGNRCRRHSPGRRCRVRV